MIKRVACCQALYVTIFMPFDSRVNEVIEYRVNSLFPSFPKELYNKKFIENFHPVSYLKHTTQTSLVKEIFRN